MEKPSGIIIKPGISGVGMAVDTRDLLRELDARDRENDWTCKMLEQAREENERLKEISIGATRDWARVSNETGDLRTELEKVKAQWEMSSHRHAEYAGELRQELKTQKECYEQMKTAYYDACEEIKSLRNKLEQLKKHFSILGHDWEEQTNVHS